MNYLAPCIRPLEYQLTNKNVRHTVVPRQARLDVVSGHESSIAPLLTLNTQFT